MRKSVWVSVTLVALLGGCASKGIDGADAGLKETFSVATHYQAAFRRAGEYVRACHVNARHRYNVSYAWKPIFGEQGAPDEVRVYKVGEAAKILERVSAEADGPAQSKVTVTVLGEGRWDAAELAAARASIQSATPVCRKEN